MRSSANPVTLRGIDQLTERPAGITIARVHVSNDGPTKKIMPFCVFDDPGTEPKNAAEGNSRIKAMLVIDEQQVLDGLYHLFPNGEFDHAPKSPASINQALVDGLKTAVAAIKGLGGDATPLEDVLKRAGV